MYCLSIIAEPNLRSTSKCLTLAHTKRPMACKVQSENFVLTRFIIVHQFKEKIVLKKAVEAQNLDEIPYRLFYGAAH